MEELDGLFWSGTCREFPPIRFAFEDLKCIDRKKYCHFFLFSPKQGHMLQNTLLYMYIYMDGLYQNHQALIPYLTIPVVSLVPSLMDVQRAADVVLYPVWRPGHPWADKQAAQSLSWMPQFPSQETVLKPENTQVYTLAVHCLNSKVMVTQMHIKNVVVYHILEERRWHCPLYCLAWSAL